MKVKDLIKKLQKIDQNLRIGNVLAEQEYGPDSFFEFNFVKILEYKKYNQKKEQYEKNKYVTFKIVK
jgi:hypothetical protein